MAFRGLHLSVPDVSKVLRLLGTAPNRSDLPLPHPDGVELWLANDFRRYRRYLENPIGVPHWTRWFNLHSRKHIEETYPTGASFLLHQDGSRHVYLQKHWPDIPGCVVFPRLELQNFFATPKGPNRYFACSLAWQIALAIYEGFTKIEMWGYELNDSIKRKLIERPCMFYWIQQARDRGIHVQYQQEIADLPFVVGDPDSYTGLLYGYSTKPEPDWDPVSESFTTSGLLAGPRTAGNPLS